MPVICIVVTLLAVTGQFTFARVISVPQDALTIQAGLDSLLETDTIFVATGNYQEVLISPAFKFSMIGELGNDSIEDVRPVIDGGSIEAPDSTAVLSLPRFAIAEIKNFHFRNGSRNGVRSWADSVVVRNCTIDSVYEGFRQVADSIGAVVRLEHCIFQDNFHACVVVRIGNLLVARGCKFSGANVDNSRLVGVNKSVIDSCQFSGLSGRLLLSAVRGPHVITNCTFGPAETSPFETAISLGDSQVVFANNVIVDCDYGYHAVRVYSHHPDSVIIRDNTFIRCRGQNVGLMAAGALGILYGEIPTGQGALVSGNSFFDCAGHVTADDIWPSVGHPALLEHNLFSNDSLNGLPSIGGSGSQWQSMPITMRDNTFDNCGYALDGSAQTDARHNWWGQPSGPYHETLNPEGLGDTITGTAQFIPWLSDTTDEAHERVRELPAAFRLTAYPNPFNPVTHLSFTLEQTANVSIIAFDIAGRLVATLTRQMYSAGTHELEFDGSGLASGVYFARLETAQSSWTTKLLLLK